MKKIFAFLKKNQELIYSLIFSISLISCGEEDLCRINNEDKELENCSENNVFLEEKDMSFVISRTEEGKVLFSDKTPLNKLPEVGKVLALPIDDEYPVGYYGKVKEITKKNRAWEVQLEPATIAELYPDTVLYYKGPVYALNSSRAGDDVIVDIDLTFGLINVTGSYSMVSPEVEYKVETSNGKEVGRTFRLLSRVKSETEIKLLGKNIDWESKPISSVYLVGGKFSKYLGLGIKADLNGRIVGNADIDVSLIHTMQGQMDVGFSVGEHLVDSLAQIRNDFDVSINDWEWSNFQKAKGEVGFGISIKAYTDANFFKWKFSTDDNLYLRVTALANIKTDVDFANFNYKDVNNEIETGVKFLVDYKAGFIKEDINGNEIFVGWSDSADLYKPWKTFLIWPEFEISGQNHWGNSALLDVWMINDESILSFCNKALVWYEKETNKMCGYEYVIFYGKNGEALLEGLERKKVYIVYPAIEIKDNQFLRVGNPWVLEQSNPILPDNDWILP